ncbi:D-inositol-3-phosphate glycosyltransferase [Cryptosporangium aurantiacum]|uniref:D-inositol-3-phosphate glycosyltransferase n=2 Tax=Cryptosporangium aurantiacum TaxID=134849 RepID=A0A1M7RHE6_9ACTN|nr:D-inositol-3-phosphate glycosyltransferase [Cryptosporangium aurantiacum]SHN45650.1 D-inositol-3-phosphate glycosyltransferase [Cryptosporangium aurantiacum]
MPFTTRRRRLDGMGLPRRVATITLHTSPLDQPGTGDAGGLNVYVAEVSRRLAAAGVEIEIFTRATSSELPPIVEMAPGVLVRHVPAGPYEGLGRDELPGQLCTFSGAVLEAEAHHEPGWYDLVHSHYWLSGQVGSLARMRWGVPLVHSAHTLAKVKNAALADGDKPEPDSRVLGEEQVVADSDLLVANTPAEARQLIDLYGADADRVATVAPGVDLGRFRPGDQRVARRRFGLPEDGTVLLFVGRIQPLKAPDILVRAAAELVSLYPALRSSLTVVVCGGASGNGMGEPAALRRLAAALDVTDLVRFLDPLPPDELSRLYRAADVTVVPSHNESFGLVAVESQACGTPVVAAAVGGLRTAVADGVSGVLVDSHDPRDYARVLGRLIAEPRYRATLGRGGVRHAARFSWQRTADGLLDGYRAAMRQRRGDLTPV